MTSILEKTFKQTLSIMQVTGNESVARELQSLEYAIMGLHRNLGKRTVKSQVEKSQSMLKQKCQDLKLTNSEKRLCVKIIIHLGSLNESLSWVYPFIIKFIEDASNLYDKVLGHIALRIINRVRSPDIYIAINTLQKDLSSKQSVVVLIALTTLASIIDLDMVPVFQPYVDKLFKSSNPNVRCKVLRVLEVMHSIGPEYLPNVWKVSLLALCDQDPHVMSASLPLLQNLLRTQKPPENSRICEKLIFILNQIMNGRLPLDMLYAGICSPWDLIRILRILTNLPPTYFSEQAFLDIAQIVEQLLARTHASSILQVAITSECIHVIVHFHPNLDKLIRVAIDTIDITLNSENPNISHSSIEMLKCLKHIKPGVCKLFKGCLLRLLSDSNPSSFSVIVGLLDDLVSLDESKELVMVLLKKLESMNCIHLKKQIILSILRIFEQTCCKEDPDWLIKNYQELLQTLGTHFDFALVRSVVNCMKVASLEARKEEFTLIIDILNKKNATPLQYCTMFEFLLSCHEEVEKEHCENAITTLLDFISCLRPMCYTENVLLYSWKTIMEIAGRHKLSIDSCKFPTKVDYKLPMALEILRLETTHLLSEQSDLEMFISQHINILNSDDHSRTLPSQDGNFKTSPNSVASESKLKHVFKTQRYSQSRFTSDDDTVTPQRPKDTFWSKQTAAEAPTRSYFWDSNKYKSSGPDNAENETT